MSDNLSLNKDKLIDKMDDLKIKIALLSYMDFEGKKYIKENIILQGDEIFRLNESAKKHIRKKINLIFYKKRLQIIMQLSRKVLSKAAVIILFIITFLFIPTDKIKALKIKLFNFIIDMHDEYTSISLNQNVEANQNNIVINWNNTYAPAIIPDGFELSNITNNELIKVLQYSNPDNSMIIFQQHEETGIVNLDTENADKISKIFISGHEGIMVVKKNVVTISWNYDDYIFIIDFVNCSLSNDEIIKIAESVKKFNEMQIH